MGVMSYGYSGEVICHYILHPFLVFDLEIKFLEQENPPDKSCLSILFSQQVLQSRVSVKITMNDPTKYDLNLSKA